MVCKRDSLTLCYCKRCISDREKDRIIEALKKEIEELKNENERYNNR